MRHIQRPSFAKVFALASLEGFDYASITLRMASHPSEIVHATATLSSALNLERTISIVVVC
jgi:hypothetical protein